MSSRAVPDNVVVFPASESDELVRITEGTYRAIYLRHEVRKNCYAGRLAVLFRIIDIGNQFGVVVPAWYRIKILDRSGSWSVGRHSKFARDWRTVFRRSPERWSRVPMSAFRDVSVSLAVRTVIQDHEQKPLAEVNQYTVVDRILGRDDA
jgi:hypothetical protein